MISPDVVRIMRMHIAEAEVKLRALAVHTHSDAGAELLRQAIAELRRVRDLIYLSQETRGRPEYDDNRMTMETI